MNIENINYFNRACAEVNKYETKTFGVKIIKLFEEFGEFSAELVKQRGESYKEFNRDDLFEELADVQILMSSLYEDMKKRCTLVSDKSSMRIVKNDYEELKHQFGRIADPIWLYFQIASNLGKFAETVNPRTKQNDDQYRIKHLMVAQAYVLYFYDLLKIQYKNEFDFDLHFKKIFDSKIEKWMSSIKNYKNNVNVTEEQLTDGFVVEDVKEDEPMVESNDVQADVKLESKEQLPPKKPVPDMFKNNPFLDKMMGARSNN